MPTKSFKKVRDSDEVMVGARAATFAPEVVEVYGDIGVDFVWLDFEHAGPSHHDGKHLENLARAADASGTELLVRPPTNEVHTINKILDAGIRNILIPRVQTPEEVRQAVKASKYVYDGSAGSRGSTYSRASRWGGRLTDDDFSQHEDERVFIGVMIEDYAAVENITEILDVPELGFVFIGHSDLAISLGHPFDYAHEDVQQSLNTVRSECKRTGIPFGRTAADVSAAQTAIENGCQVIRLGGEISAARNIIGDQYEALKQGR